VADLLNNPWIGNILSELVVALLLFAGGFLIGRYRERGPPGPQPR